MLCFLPGQNVVQEESGGGPQQATGLGAYALLLKRVVVAARCVTPRVGVSHAKRAAA